MTMDGTQSRSPLCCCRDQIIKAAREINDSLGASPEKEAVLEAFESALKRAKIPFSQGRWFPDRVSGGPLNCGAYVDYRVADNCALLVDTTGRSPESLAREARESLERGGFSEVILFQFGDAFHHQCITVCPKDDKAGVDGDVDCLCRAAV